MQTIEVLIVVDVEGALADQQNFGKKYVYMVDNTGYVGDPTPFVDPFANTNEGGNELITTCHPGQKIEWNIAPICATDNVSISQFTGQILYNNPQICVPKQYPNGDGYVWQGEVHPDIPLSKYQYSVKITFNDTTTLTFDPFLNVVQD